MPMAWGWNVGEEQGLRGFAKGEALGGAFKKRNQDICWFGIVRETIEALGGETIAVLEDWTHVGMEHVRYIV